MDNQNKILADGRWLGANGIGRFSQEILSRLQATDILQTGPKPLSSHNLFWQMHYLNQRKHHYKLYFSPGFQPIIKSPIPYVFTLCDLIPLHMPTSFGFVKKWYYELLIKPAAKRSAAILTISEYSKNTLLEWTGLPEHKIINVGCGISTTMTHVGKRHTPGYPYFLHVGNTKYHKNIPGLLQGFARAKIDSEFKLILTGQQTEELNELIRKNKLVNRIIFSNLLTESQLAEYYRGATALILPSLYEGFGLPILEAMASGTPVIASDVTAMPEVAGDAALIIQPYVIDSITDAVEQMVSNPIQRMQLIGKGLQRSALFSWDATAQKVQMTLNQLI